MRIGLVLALASHACSSDPVPPPPTIECAPDAARLGLADVSILYPLPATVGGGDLPRVTTAMAPDDLIAQAPLHGIGGASGAPRSLDELRVVALRVDPCFRRDDGGCEAQLRLVAQPLATSLEAPYWLADRTVHLFYALDDEAFAATLEHVRALKRIAGDVTTGAPLDVHPVLIAQGLGGPYATQLTALIDEIAVLQRLSRVATMGLVKQESMWQLTSFDVDADARLAARSIAGLAAPGRSLQIGGGGSSPELRLGSGNVAPVLDPDPMARLRSGWIVEHSERSVIEADVREMHRIEDPHRADARSVDCATCHWSSRGRRVAEDVLGVGKIDAAYQNARHDLAPTRRDVPDPNPNLPGFIIAFPSPRAFGYLHDRPVVIPRVIHESAVVADVLSCDGAPP